MEFSQMDFSKKLWFLISHLIGFLFWFGGAVLCLGLFIHLNFSKGTDFPLQSFDQDILILTTGYHWRIFNRAVSDLMALGSPTLIALFTLLGLLVMRLKKDQWGAFYLLVGATGAGVLSLMSRLFLSHDHPSLALRMAGGMGNACPSEIAILASSFYLIVAYLACGSFSNFGARVLIFLFMLILTGGVSLAPIYLEVAYPSDVLSGVLLGSFWGFMVVAVVSTWRAGKKAGRDEISTPESLSSPPESSVPSARSSAKDPLANHLTGSDSADGSTKITSGSSGPVI